MKFKSFLAIGLAAVSLVSISSNVFSIPTTMEYQSMLNQVKQAEDLDINPTVVDKDWFGSYSKTSLKTETSIKNGEINLGIGTTNLLKVLAPIDSLKANTKGNYDFTALHEFAHSQMNHLTYNKNSSFNLEVKGLPEKEQSIVTQKINNFMSSKSNRNNPLAVNFQENLADTYASVLMIRNLSGKYSDDQIKNVITSRYSQVHNQNSFAFGAFGDIEHRTDLSLGQILKTPFSEIRAMSPKQALDFTSKTASIGAVKQFEKFYTSMFNSKGFKEGLTEKTILTMNNSDNFNFTNPEQLNNKINIAVNNEDIVLNKNKVMENFLKIRQSSLSSDSNEQRLKM